MVDFTIKTFLWCNDPKAGKKGSDKIWGYVEVEGKLYNFWGRRADDDTKKHLTFKYNPGRWSEYDLRQLAEKKRRDKGYMMIACDRDEDGAYPVIERVYPNFVKSFKGQLMLAKLSDRIIGVGED